MVEKLDSRNSLGRPYGDPPPGEVDGLVARVSRFANERLEEEGCRRLGKPWISWTPDTLFLSLHPLLSRRSSIAATNNATPHPLPRFTWLDRRGETAPYPCIGMQMLEISRNHAFQGLSECRPGNDPLLLRY